jgi:uncharacterized membrane protein
MKSQFLRKLKCTFTFLTILIVTVLIIIASCGGGFHDDSDNVDEFFNPIFTSDTDTTD